jgi:hypothetical protein
MAYIGQSIKNGTFTDLGFTGTFNSSTTDFNLGTQVGSAAQLLVSKNGVIQRPGTDFTLASGGSQISFTTAPASGDSIFIVEISGAIGGPMNRDINGEELILDVDGDTSIQADTDDQIDIKIAGADDFKFTANNFNILSGSTLTIDSGATITNSGTATGFNQITMVDQFRLTANYSIPTSEGSITSNLERSDSRGAASFGSIQMSESSGIFTFPSTGFYLIIFTVQFYTSANNGNLQAHIKFTSDNSSYDTTAYIQQSTNANQSLSFGSGAVTVLLDITDTSNQKVKFNLGAGPSGTPGVAQGDTDRNETTMMFIRIGDT